MFIIFRSLKTSHCLLPEFRGALTEISSIIISKHNLGDTYFLISKVDGSLCNKLVGHIRRYWYPGISYNEAYIYFDEDEFKYWTMGNPIEETIIINRARKKDSYESRLKNGTLPEQLKRQNK